jgi:hypothetical protein
MAYESFIIAARMAPLAISSSSIAKTMVFHTICTTVKGSLMCHVPADIIDTRRGRPHLFEVHNSCSVEAINDVSSHASSFRQDAILQYAWR